MAIRKERQRSQNKPQPCRPSPKVTPPREPAERYRTGRVGPLLTAWVLPLLLGVLGDLFPLAAPLLAAEPFAATRQTVQPEPLFLWPVRVAIPYVLPLSSVPLLLRRKKMLLAVVVARLLFLALHSGGLPWVVLPLVARALVLTALVGFRERVALRPLWPRNPPPPERNEPNTVQPSRMANGVRVPIKVRDFAA